MTLRQNILKKSLEAGLTLSNPEGFDPFIIYDEDVILALQEHLRLRSIYSRAKAAAWTMDSTLYILELDSVPEGIEACISEFCEDLAKKIEV